MSNNSSDSLQNLPIYISYCVQGFVISSCNLLIVFCILKYEALRTVKEYVLMLGLSLADSCLLCSFLFAGIYRIYLLMKGDGNKTLTPWECAIKPHSILMIIGFPWSYITLAIMSLDRLFCVSMPLKYIGWSRSYIYTMLSVSLTYSMISCCIYLVVAYGSDEPMSAICLSLEAIREGPSWLPVIFQGIPVMFGFLSIIIYIVVWYKHKKHFSKVEPSSFNKTQQKEQLRHQNKITTSLGISCLCTFIFLCMPLILANLFIWLDLKLIALFCYFLTTLNSLCNVLIYQIRHKEIRMALKGLILCKNLPMDVRMWNVNQNANSNLN